MHAVYDSTRKMHRKLRAGEGHRLVSSCLLLRILYMNDHIEVALAELAHPKPASAAYN